jgi:hypothetical protein
MSAATLLLLLATATPGGWFGPSDEAACIEAYSIPAASKKLVLWARNQCEWAFDESAHEVLRERALCSAELIVKAASESALQVAFDTCAAKHPAPDCVTGKTFNFEADRCEVTCPAGEKPGVDGDACVSVCKPGATYIAGRCLKPLPPGTPVTPPPDGST